MESNWNFLGAAELAAANRVSPPVDVFESGVLISPGRENGAVAVWSYDVENDVAVVSSSEPEAERLHLVDTVSIGGEGDGFRVTVPHRLVSGSEESSDPLQELEPEQPLFEPGDQLLFLSRDSMLRGDDKSAYVLSPERLESIIPVRAIERTH